MDYYLSSPPGGKCQVLGTPGASPEHIGWGSPQNTWKLIICPLWVHVCTHTSYEHIDTQIHTHTHAHTHTYTHFFQRSF